MVMGGHRMNIAMAEISANLLALCFLLYKLKAVDRNSIVRQRKMIIAAMVAISTWVPLLGDENSLTLLVMSQGAASTGSSTYTPINV